MKIRMFACAMFMGAMALAGCGTEVGVSDKGVNVTVSDAPVSVDMARETAALAAAQTLMPVVKTTLAAKGLNVVMTDTEMEEENGQRFAVVFAQVTIPELRDICKLEYETRATTIDLYFDEVITKKVPDGVEVKGQKVRDNLTPASAFDYLNKNHRDCLVPNAKRPKA